MIPRLDRCLPSSLSSACRGPCEVFLSPVRSAGRRRLGADVVAVFARRSTFGHRSGSSSSAYVVLTYNQMVVRMEPALSDDGVDRLFHALADATRRDIVARAL